MRLKIFDLDHTVIDSSHRQLTRPDGSLDLDHWRENCTRNKIFRDKLLPLARTMRRANRQELIAICTARVMTKHDYHYLKFHGLHAPIILSRDGDTDCRGDAELKHTKITGLLASMGINCKRKRSQIFLFDDNQNVLTMAKKELKITPVNSIKLNRKLKNG